MQTQDTVEHITSKTPNELKQEGWSDIGSQKEIWKQISENDLYEVSSLGRIRTVKYGNIVKSYINKNNKNDYFRVTLRKNGAYKRHLLHRLIAKTFIPNPNELPCVNHKDLNKLNNNIENLEWVTHKQNSQHAVKNKRFISGENHHCSKLNKEKVDLIRLMYLTGNKQDKEISELYGVSISTLKAIVKNETWKDEEYEFIINSKIFKKRKILNYNCGTNNGNGKLNEEKVKTIRELYEHWDYSALKLGRLFDIGKTTVFHIIHRRTWKHI